MDPKSCQAHCRHPGAAPNIQSAQRSCGLRQKLLQVRKREVEAQPAFWRVEVGGILLRAALKTFVIGLGGHLFWCDSHSCDWPGAVACEELGEAAPDPVAGEYRA